jgi:hypothetical protein
MRRWLHVVVLHDSSPALPVVVYAASYLQAWLLPAAPGLVAELTLWLAFIGYGSYRVVRFHPAIQTDYRDWLRHTPWRAGKPLPLGPVHLLPQDVVILGGMVALAWPLLGADALLMLRYFVIGYLAPLAMALYIGQAGWFGYFIALNGGFLALFWDHPVVFLAVSLVSYAVGLAGLRHSLVRLPWDAGHRPQAGKESQMSLGWPFAQLGPKPGQSRDHAVAKAIAVGLLVGWVAYAIDQRIQEEGLGAPLRACVPMVFIWLALTRLLQYRVGYAAPLSLLGRLRSGRLVIKGYDQIFAAPLLTVFVPIVALMVGPRLGWPTDVLVALALAAGVAITFGMGPSLLEWRLTGNHRIVPTGADMAQK